MYHVHSTLFFINDTATTEIYTLSLHDALPIFPGRHAQRAVPVGRARARRPANLPDRLRSGRRDRRDPRLRAHRSEEHTSELQSHVNLVCRLLLEKKKRPQQKHEAVAPYLTRAI